MNMITKTDDFIKRVESTAEEDFFTSRTFYHLSSSMFHEMCALLKEQESVEPTLIREGRNKYYNDYVCPRCDNEVVYEQNYCKECGIQFTWKGQ